MEQPLISVIIPTYNRGNTLRNAAASVLHQTYQNIELIVVDDCSKEPVATTLADISDSRLHIFRHPENLGQAAGRNTGAQIAKGSFLAFLDDDDLWAREKLAHQLDYMKRERSKASITNFSLMGEQRLYDRYNSKYDSSWLSISGCALALPSSILIEKEAFQQIGGFDTSPNLRRIEDWDFAIKIKQAGFKLTIVPEFLTMYAGMHRASPDADLANYLSMKQKYAPILTKGSRDERTFAAAIDWKSARAEVARHRFTAGARKLASAMLKHPIDFSRYVKVVLGPPIHHYLARRPQDSGNNYPNGGITIPRHS